MKSGKVLFSNEHRFILIALGHYRIQVDVEGYALRKSKACDHRWQHSGSSKERTRMYAT